MKVAILTNFMEFNPAYSLTGIVKDQIRMLKEYGNEVHLYVNEKYNDKKHPYALPEGVEVRKKVTFAHLKDYQRQSELTPDHKIVKDKFVEVLKEELKDFDFAFTHDFIFQGWFLPYGLACVEASHALPNLHWMHWIHSVPSGSRDWWNSPVYGPRHKLIYPNEADRIRVAEQYRGTIENVRTIPHIKDMRSWFEFSPEACEFIKEHPGIMQADVVQVYPASGDRLDAKNVKIVIKVFQTLKSLGKSVFLLIANQWATTVRHREQLSQDYIKFIEDCGLIMGDEVQFTSLWRPPKYEVGIRQTFLRELMQLGNLFVFPTREESFGLVLPEASLSGGCMCVLNRSLTQQMEISGMLATYFQFGSYDHDVHHDNDDNFYRDVAIITTGRMMENESLMTRTYMRQRYNWDNLYARYYLPVMAALKK